MDVSPGTGDVRINGAAPSSYPETYSYVNVTSVRLEAVPEAGYAFTEWSGSLTGTSNPSDVWIDCVKTITANFTELPDVPLWAYDMDGSGLIEKAEAVYAILDYFDGTITRQRAQEVHLMYTFGAS